MALTGLIRDGGHIFVADAKISGDTLELAAQRIRDTPSNHYG
ncbi:MAG: hypothetical protein R3F07_19725 [Opitutaceae bacterium]